MRYCRRTPTICWDCKNAVKKCSWSKDFIPVENWEAIPTTIKQVDNREGRKHKVMQSYIVVSCPQFVKG